MKLLLNLLVSLSVLGGLASCTFIVEEPELSGSSGRTGSASAYDDGFSEGRDDGRDGRSRNPQRYSSRYFGVDRNEFFQGYEDGYNRGIRRSQGSGRYGQPLSVETATWRVNIREGGRQIASCVTAGPNVETTRFINEQQEIVVKSRGNHGPATLQLFDTRTGAEKDRVMAYAVRGGHPRWASGMGE